MVYLNSLASSTKNQNHYTNDKLEMIDYVIEYMKKNNQKVFQEKDEYNIVYLEGLGEDLRVNDNKHNEWNDLRLVFTYIDGCPEIVFKQIATTEPGRYSTNHIQSIRRGGVARIAFGQYDSWKIGFHKQSSNKNTHPALVQCAPVLIHRDLNRDTLRINDATYSGIFGINQHGTKIGYSDNNLGKVENWSEGCLVGKDWNKHLEFINLIKQDKRYIQNNEFIFTTTIIPADKLNLSASLVFI